MGDADRLLAVIREEGKCPLYWACYLAAIPNRHGESRLTALTDREPRLWQERMDIAGCNVDPSGDWWVGVT